VPLSGVTDGSGTLTVEASLGGPGRALAVDLSRSTHGATIDITITCEYPSGATRTLFAEVNTNTNDFHQIMLPVQDEAGVDVANTESPNLAPPIVSGQLKLVVTGADNNEQLNIAVIVEF